MGGLFAKLHRLFDSFPRDQRILMLGLDAAGKTTVLYQLKLGEPQHTIPTIGFNVETVSYKSTDLTIWDVGGQQKIRPLWRHYYQNTDALIWVIDSADAERLTESEEELRYLLQQDELRNAVVLVFANKADLPGAMGVKELAKGLGLDRCRGRDWYVQRAVATSGEGLYEGLDWMRDALMKRHQQKS